jgi:hypothetical protein
MNAERLAWVLLMAVGVILPSILGHWDIALAGLLAIAMLAWALWKEKKR